MRGVNGSDGILGIMRNIANDEQADGFVTGELMAGGKIRIGDTTIEKDDYTILTNTIIIDGKTVSFPSVADQTVEMTYTHPHSITPDPETKIIKFPKIPVGATLLMMQLEDGGYIVFGEV